MFALCIDRNSGPGVASELQNLARRGTALAGIPFDDSACWSDGAATLIQQRRWNTPESSHESGILHHAETGTRIVAWARIDNRGELLSQLPASLHRLAGTDQGLILASYLHWKNECCEHLLGDFAFAIWDQQRQRVFAARDHMGVRPLYCHWDGSALVLATSLSVFAQLKSLPRNLSEAWLVAYLVNQSQDWHQTTYEQVRKIPPAHTLHFEAGRSGPSPKLKPYFEFHAESAAPMHSDEEYVEQYRSHLREAVQCRLRSDYPIGSESSGGLDSSTITAMAGQLMPEGGTKLHALGFVRSELDPACILSVSANTPLRMTHLVTSTHTRKGYLANPDCAFHTAHHAPLEHGNASVHEPLYEQARLHKIRTLLSGFGGDEFTTYNGNLARNELWNQGRYGSWYSRMYGTRSDLKKPLRALRWLARREQPTWTSQILTRQARINWRESLLNDQMRETHPLEQRAIRMAQHDTGRASINEFILQNRWSPLMTARLENCSLIAAHYGIEYRWPLLDVRLLKCWLAAPAEQKLGPGGITRYLHRRAVTGIVPDLISGKEKYMGEPMKHLGGLSGSGNTTGQERRLQKITQYSELHPRLQQLVCPTRLAKLQDSLSKPGGGAGARHVLFKQVYHLRNLNRWLALVEP